MDLTMIDVSDLHHAAIGDEVVLIGQTAHCAIGADDHARIAGTVVYEILCGLSPRIPRIYVD
jgi:alanine racemase